MFNVHGTRGKGIEVAWDFPNSLHKNTNSTQIINLSYNKVAKRIFVK